MRQARHVDSCRRLLVVRILSWLACLVLIGAGWPESFAQPNAPAPVFAGAPPAQWIAHPSDAGDGYGVWHFRRTLELPSRPEKFIVHVSGDNRYRLFVNGQSVATGPERSDPAHWRYRTIDLAPFLNAGRNVLAAVVWNWGAARPVAQFSRRTAFLVQGNSPAESLANTGSSWKTEADGAYAIVPIDARTIGGYYASPPGEAVDAARYPWGWQQPGFDDQSWPAAKPAVPGPGANLQLRGTQPFGEAGGWQLVPGTLPPIEEKPVRFSRVRRAEGVAASDTFLRGQGDLVIPAQTRAVLLLDQDHLTNAYAVVETSGGAGATIELVYAEALKDASGKKGQRDEIEGKTINGVRDRIRTDGGAHRRFQSLWFRTYRYVQLEISTADQPLQIHDVSGIFTAYPFEEKARFTSDLPWIPRMNWRVSRLCAFETYFDTPYYEQLQYVGDTRIQSLISLYMSGDDRLVRQAITHYDLSRIPEGLTGSRYPSSLTQIIPPFSLIWVAMVHDYWMHRDDPEYVRNLLPGVRAVLGYFERSLDASGLTGPMPFWNFADWSPDWRRGVPPGGDTGGSTVINLLLVYALQRSAELEAALGQPAEATRQRALVERIQATVRAKTWNSARGLFADAPGATTFSQQANTLAILTDTVPAAEQRALMERILSDKSLTQASYYFGFYVREALRRAGLGERYIEQLAPWQEMLKLGLTTTPENPEPTRSDSHAWSAHPNYGLLATVLGVRPLTPGFRSVLIAPNPGPLGAASGSVPHPLGNIEVHLTRQGAAGLKLRATLPAGLDGVAEWQGRRVSLKAGTQEIDL
jgi:alpha-L-rhamnosidase